MSQSRITMTVLYVKPYLSVTKRSITPHSAHINKLSHSSACTPLTTSCTTNAATSAEPKYELCAFIAARYSFAASNSLSCST